MSLSNFDLSSFKRETQKMIATNDAAYLGRYDTRQRAMRLKDYSEEEIQRIINSGSLVEQQDLSRNYFYKDGFYRRIIIHYATLLKYVGLLIPNPTYGKTLSKDKNLQKKYYGALDFMERVQVQSMLSNMSQKALTDGCYYGVIANLDKNGVSILDLPGRYCCSRFKDLQGNQLIEFDVTYFNSIIGAENRRIALNAYPEVISKAYRKYQAGKAESKWVIIPSDIGICFPFFDGRPLFLNVIPAAIAYDEAVGVERERDLEEIRKIIVQKIPHLSDGGLLFEPEEAAEMHAGAVGMMKGNKNVSVLTTYTDVDAIVSKTSSDNIVNTLEKMSKNIYANAGVSSEIFAASGSASLATSLRNDLALMMILGYKYSTFFTNIINKLYGNGAISFSYQILPVSYYNEEDYINQAHKLGQCGYSLLLPSIAFGINQRNLTSLKDLENDVLKLSDKLKKPETSTAATASDADKQEVGRPKLSEENKSEKTIENEKSIENTGQGGSAK